MSILRKNNKKRRLVSIIFRSKYVSLVIGLICVSITIAIWKTAEIDNLAKLSQNVESITEIYASKVEGRIDNIEFILEELAGNGPPDTLIEERDWDMRTEFHIQNLTGIANIVWVDRDLIIRRVMPIENSKYIINMELNNDDSNFDHTNLMFLIYNDGVVAGFILGDIDVPMLIISVDFEFENDYMLQVFDGNQLLASSDNWQESDVDISAKKDISFKTNTYSFVLTPTEETVSLSIRNSSFILIFGLSLSVLISVIAYYTTVSSIRLEGLVADKTMELIKTIAGLKHEKDLAQNYLNIAGVMIVILDSNGNVSLMNRKGCNIIGINEKDIIGKNWFDNYIPKGSRNKMRKVFSKVFDKDSKLVEKYENIILTSSDEKRLISWNNSVLYDIDKNIIGVLSSGEDITELKQKEDELSYLSYHDQLTGLYNRRFFVEQMSRFDNPRNLPLSIIMGDVNGLKLINDAFGHQTGDDLLKMIGDTISKSIRGNDIAARWGGDEFTVLLPNTTADEAEILIARIQKMILKAAFKYGKISISFGIDTKKEKQEDLNKIFISAEELMYQNKLVEIDSIRGETINTIMTTLFEKSAEVKEHSVRVSELSVLIAKKMGLSKANINDIKTMGMIHDIGKIVIDLHILDKPGKLTSEEREIIQQHPLSGSRMLNSSHEYTRLAAGVLHHHERIDGKGYPNGIVGDQIPLESKIIAVADAYDAMTAERPYRLNPLTTKEAIDELHKHSGTQFDINVVDIFVNKVLVNHKYATR